MANKRAHIALLAGTAAAVLAVFIACETQDESPAGFSVNFVGMEAGAFGLESFGDNVKVDLQAGSTEVKGDNVTATLYETNDHSEPLTTTCLSVRNADGTATGINFNGGKTAGDMSDGTIDGEPDRYISVPVGCAGRLSVLYKGNNKPADISEAGNHLQIAFVTEDGTVLAWQPVPVMDMDAKETGVRVLSADITKAATVRIVFSSNGTCKPVSYPDDMSPNPNKSAGSIDVFSITFVPVQ
ncbi:MAG: hypothetical protein K2N31_03735 [Treponemataceae bacterium]|nr:hypothetical protein [Treponemataceae bacterium]